MNARIDLGVLLAAGRSAVGCLSAMPLFAHRLPDPSHELFAITSERPISIRVIGGLRGGSLNVRLYVRLVAPSHQQVVVVGYADVLRDRHGRELLAFH